MYRLFTCFLSSWLEKEKLAYAEAFNPNVSLSDAQKFDIIATAVGARGKLLEAWENKNNDWKFEKLEKDVQHWTFIGEVEAGACVVKAKAKAVMSHPSSDVARMVTSIARSTQLNRWLKEDRLIVST